MSETVSSSSEPGTRKGWPICAGLTLRGAPIVQAPLGACDGPRLAAAVTRAGALGCLSLHAPEVPVARRMLARLRWRTRGPVLVAFTAQFEREAVLDACLAAGIRYFQVFWWNGPRLVPRIHAAGGTVFWQVGTVEQAQDALYLGADVLVAQGTEAGGPVRSPLLIRDLIFALRDFSGDVPLIAAGGMADRRDVGAALSWGAKAAMLGTRFLLSEEAWAAPRHKARLLRADADDLHLDTRLVGSWPCAPRRRLRVTPDEDVPDLFAGQGIGRIGRLLSAAEIVQRLSPAPSAAQAAAAP